MTSPPPSANSAAQDPPPSAAPRPSGSPSGPHPPPRARRRFGLERLGADLAYVLPGFFLSLFAFVVLVPLFALSLGTLVVWIGALLLPVTLYVASGFAQLSRLRLRLWGRALPPVRYRAKGPGILGVLRWLGEPRRWLDLAFETLVAFPLRIVSFAIAVTWICVALGGLSWWAWGFWIPGDEPMFPGKVLAALSGGAAPAALTHSFAFEAVCYMAIGAVFLVTLPVVARGLARIDAATTTAALWPMSAAEADEQPASPRPAPDAARFASGEGDAARFVSGEGWAWIAAGFVAVAAVSVGWPVLSVVHEVPVVLAMLVVIGQAAGLLLALRRPWIGIVLATIAEACAALLGVWHSEAPWPWPVTLLIVQAILVLILSLRNRWPWAVLAWGLPQLVPLLAFVSTGPAFTGHAANLVVSLAVSAGVGAVGAVLRLWLASRGALRAERRTTAKLDARQRELAERNRIAQELHDVVAHSMSVVSVQATTAKYRLDGVSDETAAEFASIAGASRRALAEMRGLLGVLRDPESDAQLAPQPGFVDVPSLVEATRQSGARIEFRDEVQDPAAVPAAVGLTAYRIVQEALSNAVRHAPGAPITVASAIGEGRLSIDIVNGPAAADAEAAAPGAGLGLAGIRDRATAVGGSVETGPTSDGGFRIHAILPCS